MYTNKLKKRRKASIIKFYHCTTGLLKGLLIENKYVMLILKKTI